MKWVWIPRLFSVFAVVGTEPTLVVELCRKLGSKLEKSVSLWIVVLSMFWL